MLGTLGCVSLALAVDPRLGSISPVGVQVGVEAVLTFNGARLADAQSLIFYKPGIQVVALEEAKDNFVRAKLKVAADCPLGEHHVRVRTAGGLTELRTFFVGPFPIVTKVPAKIGEGPQVLPINCTVMGSVANETVDRYVVQAKKGQRLSVEVESMRLGQAFYDPYVAIIDTKGFVLSRSDDTPLFVQDCFASATIPEDGTYTVEVRETSYRTLGLYRMHVGAFARPTAIYPAGGQTGQELMVKFIDKATGDFSQSVKLVAPDTCQLTDGRMEQPGLNDHGVFPARDGVVAPSWNRVRISNYPNALEQEPNDNATNATVVSGDLPMAFNGIIEKPGDVDWFTFKGKAGQQYDVHVYARRLRSGLDSVLAIGNAVGGTITGNDDSGGPDSYVRFGVPADGNYTLRITDHLGGGGPDFVYRVEFQPVAANLSVYVPDTSLYDTQTRKSVVVARGNRFPLVINARRNNFGGELKLAMKDFPPGIQLHSAPMAANQSVLTMVFEAAADAPLGGNLGNLIASLVPPTNAAPNTPIITGNIWQNFDLVQSGNQGVYYRSWADKIAVVVVEELPFKIRVEPIRSPLVRNGTLPVKIIAERTGDFTGNINVQMLTRPPGLNCPASIDIPAGQTSAIYNFSAEGGAELKLHQIALLGLSSVKAGNAYVSTQLTGLDIKEQFVAGNMPIATTIQGYPTQVKCEITQKLEFPGKATVELLGLPTGATTHTVEMTKDSKEIVFNIVTAPDARVGLHRSLLCQMTVSYNDTQVTQTFGDRGTLRVDPPPAPPVPRKPIETGLAPKPAN